MSANDATPTGEVEKGLQENQQGGSPENFDAQNNQPAPELDPDEPIMNDGVNYDVYAEGAEEAKSSEEDLNFSSEDLANRKETEYFVNVEGAEKRKREAEKAEKTRAKKRLKDAKKTKNHTQKKIKQQGDGSLQATKRRILFGKIAKKLYESRKVIAISVAVIAVIACAIIFVPKIFAGIQQAAEDNYIAENKDELLALFEQVAGQSLTKEELEEKAKAISDKIKIVTYSDNGYSLYDENYSRTITFTISHDDKLEKLSGFSFVDYARKENAAASIEPNGDKYVYRSENDAVEEYDDVKKAIKAYVLSGRNE